MLLSCWHGSETADSRFLDQVQAMVDAFTVRPVTATDLLSAEVPALRGNPAGRLVDGTLSGPGGGQTSLSQSGDTPAPAFGDLTADGIGDAAAIIWSTSGAGGGDEYVELYTNGGHLLGGLDPARVDPYPYHAHVEAMLIRDGSVLLDWIVYREGAPPPQSFWSARLTWNRSQVVLSDLAPHTGITHSGLWSDPSLIISTDGLGAVRIGMSHQQAEKVAGVLFDGTGDGYSFPNELPPNYPEDYVGGGDGPVTCVGAAGTAGQAQSISTPSGVRLGDPASKIRSVYGASAVFIPAPLGGLAPTPGYVVVKGGRALAFGLGGPGGQTVIRIAAGAADLTPSGCTG